MMIGCTDLNDAIETAKHDTLRIPFIEEDLGEEISFHAYSEYFHMSYGEYGSYLIIGSVGTCLIGVKDNNYVVFTELDLVE